MTRYYFDIHDGEDFPDEEGSLCIDDLGARAHAEQLARDLVRDMPEGFAAQEIWTIGVSSPRGALHATLRFLLRISQDLALPELEFAWSGALPEVSVATVMIPPVARPQA